VKSLARRYFEDLFNAADITVADEIIDPEVSFTGPIHPHGFRGMEAFRAFAHGWFIGFPDRHFEVLDEWVNTDAHATRFHITGTHLGEFLGRTGTGNIIDVPAVNVMRVRAGKIYVVEAYFDPRDILVPLGLAVPGSVSR
jgi:predicted ester cyclase